MEDVAFFHLLGAFSFVAGTVVAGATFEVARRGRQRSRSSSGILLAVRELLPEVGGRAEHALAAAVDHLEAVEEAPVCARVSGQQNL